MPTPKIIPDWYPRSNTEKYDKLMAGGYALAMLHLTPGGDDIAIRRVDDGPTVSSEFGDRYAQGGGCMGEPALYRVWAEFAAELGLPVVTPDDVKLDLPDPKEGA